jgi:hypothetical protein
MVDSSGLAGGKPGNMAAGYAYSIYLMLAVPAVLVTCLVIFIWRQSRETTNHAIKST